MMKIALLSLLTLAGLSIAAEVRQPASAATILSPDVPPPTCAPNCPLAR